MTQPVENRETPSRNSLADPSAQAWASGHDVQFYDDEGFLCAAVAQFIEEGIRVGQPVIVIATAAHRKAFSDRMRERGIDLDELHPDQVVWLDARDTLKAFMDGGRPSADLFDAAVGSVFEKVIGNRRYVTVRAYGEMVDVLWREGQPDAALQLERLWNRLASKFAFKMLCAYAKESLGRGAQLDSIARICALHSRVLPSSIVPPGL